MKLDESRRYTNRELIQALNASIKQVSSEVGALGKVTLEQKKEIMDSIAKLQNQVITIDDWRKGVLAVEADRQLRKAIRENPNQQIVKEVLKLLGIALVIIGSMLGVKLL